MNLAIGTAAARHPPYLRACTSSEPVPRSIRQAERTERMQEESRWHHLQPGRSACTTVCHWERRGWPHRSHRGLTSGATLLMQTSHTMPSEQPRSILIALLQMTHTAGNRKSTTSRPSLRDELPNWRALQRQEPATFHDAGRTRQTITQTQPLPAPPTFEARPRLQAHAAVPP